MPRRIETVCEDCHRKSDSNVPIIQGQIVSKGSWPVKVCENCGTVVSGTPGILACLYHRLNGHWPWQDE